MNLIGTFRKSYNAPGKEGDRWRDEPYANTLNTFDGGEMRARDLIASALTASAGHHGHSSPRGDGTDNIVPVTAFDWQAGGSGDTSWGGKARSFIDREHYAAALQTTKVEAVHQPVHHARVRRLTPVECERLQGFPDGWTEPAGSDSARYRCLGNAVTVPVAEWLGRRLMAYEAGELEEAA